MKTPCRLPPLWIFLLILLALMFPALSKASDHVGLPDGAKLKMGGSCPVCGMQIGGELGGDAIYAYDQKGLIGFAGIAAAIFDDGKVVGFDGARCLFIYNSIPKKFGIDVTKIRHRYVTDFMTKKLIDVDDAFLVLGSTVRGFMGYDLVPFSSKEEAEKFSTKYGGKRIIQLRSVKPEDVERK
jgi:nitrous oxide reductase accessory protein NosL